MVRRLMVRFDEFEFAQSSHRMVNSFASARDIVLSLIALEVTHRLEWQTDAEFVHTGLSHTLRLPEVPPLGYVGLARAARKLGEPLLNGNITGKGSFARDVCVQQP